MADITIEKFSSLIESKFGIVGRSKPIWDAVQLLMQAAPTDLSVLITGETGTGKEIFANALHGLSNRKKFPFISVNCGAIPETLLESELFGHEKGAFTGATDQRKGFFETAHRGTILLDEIGEMPVGTQVKLLRVLESGEFSRLGSSSVHKVDVRVVAATNRELEQEVANGNFRQDLFFRLKNVQIILPPLRKHLEDIPLLVEYFAGRIATKLGFKYEGASDDAIQILKSLPWAGNVRELKNLIETIITLEEASYLTPEILQKHIARALPAAEVKPVEESSAMIPITATQGTSGLEFELVFRTLLELKNDMADMKRFLHSIAVRMDDMNEEIRNLEIKSEADYEEIPTVNEDDLRIDEMEKKLIKAALKRFEGNRRLAAESLGISERTLYRKISEYDLGA
jgi:transcriptional regulator with PAS, ATPase and Fis domain